MKPAARNASAASVQKRRAEGPVRRTPSMLAPAPTACQSSNGEVSRPAFETQIDVWGLSSEGFVTDNCLWLGFEWLVVTSNDTAM
jgi:hypothetical protein